MPKYGYFPSPENLFYICKGKNEGIAKTLDVAMRLAVQFVRGHTYLGGFVGNCKLTNEWIEAKIATWVGRSAITGQSGCELPTDCLCRICILLAM